MNWNLSIGYSWWYILICLLVGGLYAGIAYYKSKDNDLFADYPWSKYLLPILRFGLVSILCFLLLGPVLKYLGYETEKPNIALLIDDSQSIKEGGLSDEKLKSDMTDAMTVLSAKYEVEPILFSNLPELNEVGQLKLEGGESNLSSAIRYVKEQYVNRNIGGGILISDGIYNAGSNPSSVAEKLKFPIYTVGVGDTTVYADIRVKNVSHNSLAYLGNEFPFIIEITADKLRGQRASVQVSLNGKPLKSTDLVISEDKFYKEIEVVGKATKLGTNRVDVKVSQLDGESNTSNNSFTFYIDIIDGKKKVAIWAASPHPDIGMLKAMIQGNDNYDVSTSIGDFTIGNEYDLVILHNWFASNAQLKVYEKLRAMGTSVLVVVGNDFVSPNFNAGTQDIKFTPSRGANSTLPLLNGSFEYFEVTDEQKASIKKWPPLQSPFGKWSGYVPSDVLLYQQIGSVPTEDPLILLANTGKTRLGIITGTGIWQWRLAEYELNNSHENVADLITKMIQYLAVKDDKQLLKVYPSARQYGVGESVTLLGELYNQSLDPISGQEINVELVGEDGKSYKHTMTSVGKQYRLVLDGLAAGNYSFSASSLVGGVKLRDKGNFIILDQQKELINLTADFDALREVAYASGGRFSNYGNLKNLADELVQNDAMKSVITEQTQLKDFIKLKWVFWLLFLLLGLEWFVRKWVGGY